MNKNELYHSDIYLGKDYSDGIKHWKYVSKEKVNGKWRYYYKHKEGSHGTAIYEKIEGDPNSKYGTYVHNGPGGEKVGVVGKGTKLFTKTWKSISNNKNITYKQIGKIEQGADATKTAISKISNNTINSVKNAISEGKSFLNNLWNKIYNKKASATTRITGIKK